MRTNEVLAVDAFSYHQLLFVWLQYLTFLTIDEWYCQITFINKSHPTAMMMFALNCPLNRCIVLFVCEHWSSSCNPLVLVDVELVHWDTLKVRWWSSVTPSNPLSKCYTVAHRDQHWRAQSTLLFNLRHIIFWVFVLEDIVSGDRWPLFQKCKLAECLVFHYGDIFFKWKGCLWPISFYIDLFF